MAHGSSYLPQRPPLLRDEQAIVVARWISSELDSLGQMLNEPSEMRFQVLHAVPHKKRVGLVVYADGTDWNPGAGEGLYVYKSGGWTLLA